MSRRSDESDLQGPDGSAYEEAAHFYGRALEPADRAALDESLEQWRGLRGEDRTFVLAHLAMLQLRAMDEICAGLERLVERGERGERGGGLGDEDEVTEEVQRAMGGTRGHGEDAGGGPGLEAA